ncbi:AAA family ATPase [Povalibacter sp.]|uniref:AAA family ATPase n=1 Tax=Povalibacter sp. TaxID=1962978 RepID=UPI002F40A83C
MVRTAATLYLPISDRLLGPILDEAASLQDAIAGLTVSQIAALIVLQYLPKKRQSRSLSPDLILSEVIRNGNAHVQRDGLAGFIAEALRILERNKIREGHRLLMHFGIALLDDKALEQREYLTVDGQWDTGFPERHRTRLAEPLQRIQLPTGEPGVLTAEQSRIFREVKAQADDHLHVQGYAGTGKSYLIKSLLTMLEPAGARILVLAERQRQLEALLEGMGQIAHVYPRRFGMLVSEMIPADLTDPLNRHMRRTNFSAVTLPDDAVIRHLGIQSSGEFLARDIVRAVRSTVAGFCYSGDDEIDVGHIPDWCSVSFDESTRQLVLHHATEFWKVILLPPSRDFQPPVRGYHRVKWAALNRWTIPARYTHVLIDECHDLAKPMLQILDRSPQAVISLGDEYQNLQGRPQLRSNVIRQRVVTTSVRSGQLIEGMVNPIIAIHPGGTKLSFHGNPFNQTEIAYYDKAELPDQPAAILVSDTWGLFEWAQRLAAQNADFELMSSRDDLTMFVNDCIELYRHGTRPRHGELFRFGSWDALVNRYCDNGGLQRIDRMLKKGYDNKDWSRTAARFVKQSGRGSALGLIEDVRNREFDTVMLVPDAVDRAWNTKHGAFAAASSAIYVAVTRARRRLIVPGRLRSWIEEISGRRGSVAGAQSSPAGPGTGLQIPEDSRLHKIS